MKHGSSLVMAVVSAIAIASGVLGYSDSAHALNREIVVHNNSRSTMVQLLGSNIGDPLWRIDFLGRRTIPPGHYSTVNIDDGSGYCRFDMKAVFSDGSEVVRRDVNVCDMFVWYISPFSDAFA